MHKQSLLTLGATGIATLALALNPTVSHMITGKNIKNGSITSADIRDHSLRSSDFAVSPSPGTPGATGASGIAGPKGDKGDPGDPAPTPRVYAWTVHYTGNGTADPSVLSSGTIPAGVEVTPVSIVVTNTHNAGTSMSVSAIIDDTNRNIMLWEDLTSAGSTQDTLPSYSGVNVSASHLRLDAHAGDFAQNTSVPVGDFDAVVTFTETVVSLTNPTAFS